MVHDKRSPIQYVATPKGVRDDQEVWYIEQTGECFVSYEAYLHRMEYYNQKRFKDDVSSRSGLTFFAAHRAERDGQQATDADFPVVLRGPILRKAQFSTISRLDELVGSLFAAYKDNILPGEEVYVLEGRNGSRSEGIVSEKTIFSASKNHPELARISVRLPASPGKQAIVDSQHIRRKPKSFTKQNLIRFLRTSLERASYDGAPWTVKTQYAAEYGISTIVPEHLTREALAAKKALQPKKIRSYNGIPAHWQMKNGLIVPKAGHVPSQEEIAYLQARYHSAPMEVQQALAAERTNGSKRKDDTAEKHMAQPAPPPIRYPIEDLQLQPKAKAPPRPNLKDFTAHNPFPDIIESAVINSLSMAYIGPLQQVWDTLQVFGGYYRLDGFTIDDFYGAMLITSDSVPCQLFDEVHCTVLKNLFEVKDKETGERGELGSKTLLDAAEAKKDDESSAGESGSTSPTTPGGQKSAFGVTTNGDAVMHDAQASPVSSHRAAEMAGHDEWPGKVIGSEFPRGGWQMIVISVLEQLSHLKRYSVKCNKILQHLAPPHLPATQQTAKAQYDKLSIDLRIEALQIMTALTFETKSFKAEMNQLMTDATETRKNKIEWQSQRKSLMKSLEKLQEERRRQRPDEPSESPASEQKEASVNGDAASAGGQQDTGEDGEDSDKEDYNASNASSDDADTSTAAALDDSDRRMSGRAATLKRKREEKDERERMQLDAKVENDYNKILDAIETAQTSIAECEETIASLDGDLRENACHRTRLLGYDRFFNRYIWFERNGMPFTGDSESPSNYGYANGRLWIQGADALDRENTVDLTPADEKIHVNHLGMTMKQRRDLEEGTTQLPDADSWGYLDTPEAFDALISWLKDKGEREKRLKRELVAFREPIVASMNALQARLSAVAKKFDDFDFEDVRPQRGVALRKRTAASAAAQEPSEADKVRYPCVAWRNSWMAGTFGHLHSDGPEACKAGLAWAGKTGGNGKKIGRPSAKDKAEREKEREASEVPERRTTRQGTKFAR